MNVIEHLFVQVRRANKMASQAQKLIAALALIYFMEETGRWDLAFVTDDPPAYHRSPIIELPPYITLDDGPTELWIGPDRSWAKSVGWQEGSETGHHMLHDVHRQIEFEQPPSPTMGQVPPAPASLPPMGWLADDGGGMPMRPLRSLLPPRIFAADDLDGFLPGPLFGQG